MATSARRDGATLTRERIVSAAIELADADGVANVSMRKIAQRLGFEAMSLYNHVGSRDDVLEGMVDAVLADVDPDASADWRLEARSTALAMHGALGRHAWATELWPRTFPGANRWRLTERLIAALTSSGAPETRIDLSFHAISSLVVGSAHVASGYASVAGGAAAGMQRVATDLPRASFPAFHRHSNSTAAPARTSRTKRSRSCSTSSSTRSRRAPGARDRRMKNARSDEQT